jgi:hypothetical protein
MFEVPRFESKEKENEALLSDEFVEVDTSEVFKANVQDGFEQSLLGVGWNQANESYQNTQGKQLTSEEWKQSPFYREGVKFEDGWSDSRAEYMARVYDEREENKFVMDKSKGFFQGAIGFAGQFAGAAIDPINFIPFAGGVAKGATLGTKLAKGAVEGAVGNLASAAVARPYWEDKGTESSWTDYAMDTAIGGLFGGAFAGAGHAYGKWREKPIPQASQKSISETADHVKNTLEEGGVHELDSGKTFKGFEEATKIEFELRNERVNFIKEEVAKITGDAEYAEKASFTIDAFAETMALEMGISPEKFMEDFGFQVEAGEMIGNGRAARITKRPITESEIEVSKLIDSEIQNMVSEIEGAQAGQKIFTDEGFAGSQKSTFPKWFKDAGFESKEEFLTAVKNKTTKFDTIKEFAEDRLKASGDQEYAALTGFGMDDVPLNEMGEPLFQFAGPNAKTAPMDKLSQALIMERDGSDIEAIRNGTGWFKAPDGKWRFEIDDSKAKFKNIDVNKKKKFKLSDVIEHDDLFEAYPNFKDINVEFAAFKGRKGGHFDKQSNTIKIMVKQDVKYPKSYHDAVEHLKKLKESPEYLELQAARQVRDFPKYRQILNDTEFGQDYTSTSAAVTLAKPNKSYPRDLNIETEAFSTILHEIQHSIQDFEGFARGGNKFLDGGYENYKRLHGEIEARNTEARRGLGPEERAKTRPGIQEEGNALIRWNGEERVQNIPEIPGDVEYKADSNGQMAFFKKANNEVKGAFTPSKTSVNGKRVPDFIHLMQNADKSTFLHEAAHWKLETMKRIIDSGKATDRIRNDYDSIVSWAMKQKTIDGNKNVQIHEAFAQGYELYLREGKAPTRELQGAFERFSEWLKNIYSRATDLDVKLNDEIKGVYDRLFQNENQRMREIEADLAPKKPAFNVDEIAARSINENVKGYDSFIEAKKQHLLDGELAELSAITKPLEEEKSFLDEVVSYFQGAKSADEAADDLDLSNDKFNKLIKEFEEKLKLENEQADLAQEAIKRAKELETKIIKEKKKLYLSLVARERLGEQVRSIHKEATDKGAEIFDIFQVGKGTMRRKATVEDALLAVIEGNSSFRGIKDGGNSISSNTQGMYNGMVGEFNIGINKLSEKFDIDMFKYYENSINKKSAPIHGDLRFHDIVYLEMASIAKDGGFKEIQGIPEKVRMSPDFVQARELAKLMSDMSLKYVDIANNLGADIGHYEGWTPRSNDIEKIAGNKLKWKSQVLRDMDIKRTFGIDISEVELDKALEVIYAELTTGERGAFDVDSMVKNLPKNLAKKISESRVIHFKDAMGELRYAQEFGKTSNIIEAMNGHFGNRAREISLMEKLGPNPESTIRAVASELRKDLKMKDTPEARDVIKALDENGIISRKSSIGGALMYALGETSEDTNLRKLGANIRAWNSLTMLGSSTLSQVSDFLPAVSERRMIDGENSLSAWFGVLKDYVSKNEDGQLVADHMGVMLDGMMADGMNRFDVANDFKTNVDGLNNKLFKIIGVDWHTKKLKKGAVTMYAKEMADSLQKSWDKIHPQMKERLTQYGGFDQKKWDFMRSLEAIELGDHKLVTPGTIESVPLKNFESFIPPEYKGEPDFKTSGSNESLSVWEANKAFELQKAKTNMANSLRSYFYESVKNNVLEPDARTRRLLFKPSGNAKAGTPAGEAVRMMAQFKTFTTLYMDRVLGGQRYKTDSKDNFGAYQYMAASLVLGYTAASLKDLAKGHEPKDPTLPQTWMQAALQSGGAGIFGDFLQGITGRSSASLLETFAGPTASRVGAITHVGGKALTQVYKGAKGEKTDFTGLTSDAIDQTKQLIPFNNVFYTRAMADYLIWHNIKEVLEPGSIRRNERRLKKDFNQKYLKSPRDFVWMK